MKKDLPKLETPQDWEKAKNFIPKKNQIIIYDGLKEGDTYVSPPRVKIGDGVRTVSELPFEQEVLKAQYDEDNHILIIS
jgi:hypothetical protein